VSPPDAYNERRRGRRVKVANCKARMKSLNTGEVFYGDCVDLSVDGLSVRTSFVPQFGERLEVIILSPAVGAIPEKPLVMEAEVCRCNEVERRRLYEIGMTIVQRKS